MRTQCDRDVLGGDKDTLDINIDGFKEDKDTCAGDKDTVVKVTRTREDDEDT